MATMSKTAGTTLLAWADLAPGNVTIGSPVNVDTKYGATIFFRLGRRSGTAFTANWPNLRVEASAKASGNDAWVPMATFTPGVGSSIASTTLNGAVSAGATSFVVASSTNIAVGDILFLKGDTDAGNELIRVKSIVTTTVTPEEAVTYAHASGNAVTDQAEMFAAPLDLTAITRLRVVFDNLNSGQLCAAEVLMVTGDATSA